MFFEIACHAKRKLTTPKLGYGTERLFDEAPLKDGLVHGEAQLIARLGLTPARLNDVDGHAFGNARASGSIAATTPKMIAPTKAGFDPLHVKVIFSNPVSLAETVIGAVIPG